MANGTPHDRRRLETAVAHGEAVVRDRQTRPSPGTSSPLIHQVPIPESVSHPRRDVTMLTADDVCKSPPTIEDEGDVTSLVMGGTQFNGLASCTNWSAKATRSRW